MPMIELTLLEQTLSPQRLEDLMEALRQSVTRAEAMADRPQVASTLWTFIDERPAGAIAAGGRPREEPRYRLQITVAAGSLDEDRKAQLVTEATVHVLEAEGSENDLSNAARVWCHIHELPDGNWGAAGRIWRLPDIVEFAGIDPTGVPGLSG